MCVYIRNSNKKNRLEQLKAIFKRLSSSFGFNLENWTARNGNTIFFIVRTYCKDSLCNMSTELSVRNTDIKFLHFV